MINKRQILLLLCIRMSNTHFTAVPQLGCSYTFLVQKDGTNCPQGAADFDTADIDVLKTVIRNQQEQLALLTQEVMKLKDVVKETNQTKAECNNNDKENVSSGSNYVRWGRTSCPDTAELVYWGYAAGSHYTHSGGGANYLCLDNNPMWPESILGGFQSYGHIYGVEYQSMHGLDSSLKQNDAPCAVCHVNGRGEQLMIPGNRTCPESWTKEYEGIIVSAAYTHKKSTYVCLDRDPEVVVGGGTDTNGALFYATESTCTALPCPPYVSGNEIACVVCTL